MKKLIDFNVSELKIHINVVPELSYKDLPFWVLNQNKLNF